MVTHELSCSKLSCDVPEPQSYGFYNAANAHLQYKEVVTGETEFCVQ